MRLFSFNLWNWHPILCGKRIKFTGKQLKNAIFGIKFCSTIHQTPLYQATKRTQNEKRNF